MHGKIQSEREETLNPKNLQQSGKNDATDRSGKAFNANSQPSFQPLTLQQIRPSTHSQIFASLQKLS